MKNIILLLIAATMVVLYSGCSCSVSDDTKKLIEKWENNPDEWEVKANSNDYDMEMRIIHKGTGVVVLGRDSKNSYDEWEYEFAWYYEKPEHVIIDEDDWDALDEACEKLREYKRTQKRDKVRNALNGTSEPPKEKKTDVNKYDTDGLWK